MEDCLLPTELLGKLEAEEEDLVLPEEEEMEVLPLLEEEMEVLPLPEDEEMEARLRATRP